LQDFTDPQTDKLIYFTNKHLVLSVLLLADTTENGHVPYAGVLDPDPGILYNFGSELFDKKQGKND
jgi:hypothetical protein